MPFLGKTPQQFVDPEVDIDGGSIDGTAIGATSASTATVTTFTSTGIDDNATGTAITIDSSQRVGIGTTSPARLLELNGTTNPALRLDTGVTDKVDIGIATSSGALQSGSSAQDLVIARNGAYNMHLCTNNSIRTTIDSSGNLLVGRTSGNPNSSSFGVNINSGGRILAASDYGATGTAHQFYGNAGAARIMGDGDLENTNNIYGGISDARLKSNIIYASPQLDDIMAVKVRSYTLNATGDTHIGVVAQELEEAGMNGLVKTDEEGIKSVKYSILYMKAIKAIQEQQAIIEDLQTRLSALEAN